MGNGILTGKNTLKLGLIVTSLSWGIAANGQTQPMPTPAVTSNSTMTVPATATTSSALAQDYTNYTNVMNQITRIDQLRDVSPQGWSYEALRNLVEGYGCIVGYPDGTYRGDRALSRNEFAAGLNACLTQIERRIAEGRGFGMTAPGGGGSMAVMQNVQPGEPLPNVFNRAFYNETGRFWDITSISGQANKIFGWRTWPGSFFDNQIANDGLTFETVYDDAMRQQTAGTRVRTADLTNPYGTSLRENPSYLRFGNSSN